jgi:arylsulfatase A-like enzyme
MKKNKLLWLGATAGTTVLLLSAVLSFKSKNAETGNTSKPNVIIILADDLGYNDLSSYGGKTPTPHIDALGKEGVRFTQAYSTAPICSPSRAGLVTGRYQQRFGVEFLVGSFSHFAKLPPDSLAKTKRQLEQGGITFEEGVHYGQYSAIRQGLPVEEETIAELFKKNGYKTALIGKWHLGEHEEFLPEARGFDYHYGFLGGQSIYASERDPKVVSKRLPILVDRGDWTVRTGASAIRRSNTVVEEKDYLTFRLAEEAEKYIEANKNNPFLLYLPFNAPHTPLQAPKNYFDKFKHEPDTAKRVYAAMLAALDDAVGRVTDKLKQLNLDQNTIVIFTSDNGAATYTRAVTNAPLRGGKLSHFEGGYNVPFFIKYPRQIKPNQQIDAPIISLDILPTVAAAAGIRTERKYDGVDLIPFLTKKQSTRPHDILFWRNGYSKAVRKGDWKLYVNDRSGKTLLFDLSKDRSEKLDYSAAKPEKVRELREALEQWEKEVGKPSWPNLINVNYDVNQDGEFYYFPI